MYNYNQEPAHPIIEAEQPLCPSLSLSAPGLLFPAPAPIQVFPRMEPQTPRGQLQWGH